VKVKLAYGKRGLEVELPEQTVIIEPKFVPGLPDEREGIRQSLQNPLGTKRLRDMLKTDSTVAIIVSDITRPVPSDRILPVLLEELKVVKRENIRIINALGLHRPNTREELVKMLGQEIVDTYEKQIINHDAYDKNALIYLGDSSRGTPMWVNKMYMESDIKVLTGFIEPHFFAGFSGGRKSVFPGIAGADTIMQNHNAVHIDHELACYGCLSGNPIHEDMLEIARRTNPDFMINVALNKHHQITGAWSGDLEQAHVTGVAFVKETAMQKLPHHFDVVITTNSGYPLDMNLYQTVKGMAAAERILEPGGTMIIASECSDGIGHAFHEILKTRSGGEELLTMIRTPGWSAPEQWQVQIMAKMLATYELHLYSENLCEEDIQSCHLIPTKDITSVVNQILTKKPEATIAVMPQGPMTIPYVEAKI
jgi:lactate racemase